MRACVCVCVSVSQVYADGVGSITFDSPNDARAAAEGLYIFAYICIMHIYIFEYVYMYTCIHIQI
jgi:hypothetical protein